MTHTEDLLLRYKQALEGLTPGGSEFVDDPEYCAEFVRRSRHSQHETIVRLTKELNALRPKGPQGG